MLREVLNAVFCTFFATEWIVARDDGLRFSAAAASKRLGLWVAANAAVVLWPTTLPQMPSATPAFVALIEAALVVAVASAAVKRCGRALARPLACASVVGVWLLLYSLNVPQLPAAAAEKFALAQAAFISTLFFDVRRSGAVPAAAFFDSVSAAVLYVAPVYPLLCVACSFVFLPIIEVFEHFRWSLDLLNAPIYYVTLYGPLAAVYVNVKRSLQPPLLAQHQPPRSRTVNSERASPFALRTRLVDGTRRDKNPGL